MSVHSQHVTAVVGNAISAAAILASFQGWLPPLAALAALIWYVVQVWESDTVQGWIHGPIKVARRNRAKERAHALLQLKINRAQIYRDPIDDA